MGLRAVSGDVNGDGLDDVIIFDAFGANLDGSERQLRCGTSYVVSCWLARLPVLSATLNLSQPRWQQWFSAWMGRRQVISLSWSFSQCRGCQWRRF
ncbi:FG-GAP repeat protein [Nitrosomonas sp.]|uniref:FG-GAP repeat protein n=1 Tax=Nitrosomonas sp. TaxID=42353 RepID=UPI002626568A|nr:FG-GAP repeat protein [Nitrosomonas sp.]